MYLHARRPADYPATWTLAGGRRGSTRRLMPVVYDQLRVIAGRCIRGEDPGNTLRPTAFVHEVYLRPAGSAPSYQDRVHFFAVTARVMRRILVDHAHVHCAQKRGGNPVKVDLDETVTVAAQPSPMAISAR